MMKIVFTLLCIVLVCMPHSGHTQHPDIFMYGKITTVDNHVHCGYLIWGKNKNLWTDVFTASKPENPYSKLFAENNEIIFGLINGSYSYQPQKHYFRCRFGNISSIRPLTNNSIELEAKNGAFIELRKIDHSDIGASIRVISPKDSTVESGVVLPWNIISKIEFMDPEKDRPLPAYISLPITGLVKTTYGYFKGFVTFAYSGDIARNGKDYFQIESEDQRKYSILFNQIKRITNVQNQHELTLYDNNVIRMNIKQLSYSENAITINMPNTGIVSIPWQHFQEFEAIPLTEVAPFIFTSEQVGKRIKGEVVCRNGEKFRGIIAYDLDETFGFEFLDGKNNKMHYWIPFRFIKSIEPKNHNYSFITLTNGSAFSLGEDNDVNQYNNGVLIFGTNTPPTYVPWKEVLTISFAD